VALLWISSDGVTADWLQTRISSETLQKLTERRETLQSQFAEPLSSIIQRVRLDYINQVTLSSAGAISNSLVATLGRLAVHPVWGLPMLAVVLYGLYWFVGVFGAGDLVGLLEENLFGEIINPWITHMVAQFIPIPLVADFLVGEYGLWTMGITYALALILPIVTTFFLAFGLLEDSGYLPRLSVLGNRLFKMMGLNGKAVLPMVLGLGCVTMATMTTRILESKRDRLLVILLLALAVPCSAQLGVVMGMLAGVSLTATLMWAGVMTATLLLVGWLAARLVPGERTPLLVEVPPLRLPVASNVIIKTLARLEWYLKEVIPLFLLGTAIMFVLDKVGALPWLIEVGKPLVTDWLGLPAEASAAFLLGFLRRDFGATGLFVMQTQGLLSPIQVVVSMVTITLFIPCIASIFMIARERGTKTAVAMTGLIFPLAFLVGGLMYRLLLLIGWNG
jgi:ferrous iron transport protein B